jgi:hypothetical protein
MTEDAGIEPWTVVTFEKLAVRRCNHSIRSRPQFEIFVAGPPNPNSQQAMEEAFLHKIFLWVSTVPYTKLKSSCRDFSRPPVLRMNYSAPWIRIHIPFSQCCGSGMFFFLAPNPTLKGVSEPGPDPLGIFLLSVNQSSPRESCTANPHLFVKIRRYLKFF